ncbi:hypothetical protein LV84_03462 [Algoriphagus ratkowskyi]|uniref:Uncharacterized protein n=1 Tax=Algoriphagus ratkowskyi TaxID=57028 RepID=A0A2W7QZK9_9BACT|nr:hypothetical protein LV84_03462 [Algoriphagus ratkowskyi]
MNKQFKTSSNVKATRQGKDTEKRRIHLKASIIAPRIVNVSLWDNQDEIASIICPVMDYGLHDSIYIFLDQMLRSHFRSKEFFDIIKEGKQ